MIVAGYEAAYPDVTAPLSRLEVRDAVLDGEIVVTWNLEGVIPVRWTGPSLNPDSPKIATETVELAVTVRIPLVGGKIETMIADMVKYALDKEHEVGVEWLARG